MKLYYFDTETTGVGDNAKIIQFAAKYSDTQEVVDLMFSAGIPIELGAMATHHITEKMIEGKPKFSEFIGKLNEDFKNYVVVAHNAKFDIGRTSFEGAETPKFVIDTLKISKFFLQEKLDSHKLQVLRYYFGIEIEANAHDALGDVLVLEKVFHALYSLTLESLPENTSPKKVIAEMINISKNPIMLLKFPFGKHKGELIEDVPKSYFEWCLRSIENLDEDLKFTMNFYLNK